jgi:hypothetical protein
MKIGELVRKLEYGHSYHRQHGKEIRILCFTHTHTHKKEKKKEEEEEEERRRK